MAIRQTGENIESTTFTVSGGDLVSLFKVQEAYKLGAPTDVIAFALGAIEAGKGRPIRVETEDGTIQSVMPAEHITIQGLD